MNKTNRLKKLYKEDFKDVFELKYLEHNKVIATELFDWNLEEDKEYSINTKLNEKLTEKYGQLIRDAYVAPMHIKWVNKMVSYGVFAETAIKRGDMIIEYTGLLTRDSIDNENPYIWDYPTIRFEHQPGKTRRKKIVYCVDAYKSGNYARFINHTHRKFQNVGIQMIAVDGFWHVVYIALKDIAKGQQFLTYYGMQYWRDRQIIPQPLMP